jgi:hypothetical protein
MLKWIPQMTMLPMVLASLDSSVKHAMFDDWFHEPVLSRLGCFFDWLFSLLMPCTLTEQMLDLLPS